jgi:hypothetical protein
MTDFISQATVDRGLELPSDALAHEAFAKTVLETTARMPPGAVVALQAPWGRGKTDVLARVIRLASHNADDTDAAALRPLWINPWQYGTPDLLTPLVIGLLDRIKARKRQKRLSRAELRRAAETVVRAGASFGLKAAAATIPGGALLEAAERPIDELLRGWFAVLLLRREVRPDPDPVAVMAERFRELVDTLRGQAEGEDERFLICVDDLDRCLPHRQVAILEALRFLSSSGAATTTLVALDPTLARQAVITHYGTDVFDPDLYLDKMFHFRISLPAMSPGGVRKLLCRDLSERRIQPEGDRTLGDWLTGQPTCWPIRGIPQEWDWPATAPGLSWPMNFPSETGVRDGLIADAIGDALRVQDLRNPRLLSRIVERLHVLACHDTELVGDQTQVPLWMSTPGQLKLFVLWIAIGERWPLIRTVMQGVGERKHRGDRLRQVFARYWPPDETPERHNQESRRIAASLPPEVEQLPIPSAVPGLRQCLLISWQIYNYRDWPSGLGSNDHPVPGAFDDSLRCEGLAGCWAEFDEILLGAGL